MTVSFVCPHCDAKTEVEDEFVGQTGPCFNCGKAVTIPQPKPVVAATQQKPSQQSGIVIGLVMGTVVVGTLAALGVVWLVMVFARPIINNLHTSSTQSKCESNLRQIAMAMMAYHDDWRSFPPAHRVGPDGKPAHSWRVLLLPYLESKALYDQYDFSQAWDSPTNLYIANQMPAVYGCPADPNSRGAGTTNYMVVVGNETIFPSPATTSRRQIGDGLENTLMVVEVSGANVTWTQPQDLDIRGMTFEINGGSGGKEISSLHPGGAVFAAADGTTYLLPDNTPPEFVEALITANGGEQFTPYELAEFGQ